jgi:hypothetical protein
LGSEAFERCHLATELQGSQGHAQSLGRGGSWSFDLLWTLLPEGLVRRSLGSWVFPMNCQAIRVLTDHQWSDLLFPSEAGGFRSPSVLDKLFREVALAIKVGRHVTPRAMRRTYQDLARAAEMRDLITRAISGHATERM